MKIKNITTAIAAALLCQALTGTAAAKTASWSVSPQYSAMEQLVPGAYKVKRGIYTGVIDANGKEIIKMTTDSITPFVGGQALVLTPGTEGRYRLQAILHDDLTQSPVYDEVWVEDYPFFSENMLPVRASGGLYGYMDPAGRMVLQPAYTNVHPFSEGYAAVVKVGKGLLGKGMKVFNSAKEKISKKGTTMVYINRGGTELKTQKDIGKIVNASTFNNGVALVQNNQGSNFLINTAGAKVASMPAGDYAYDDRYVYIDENYDDHPFNSDYLTTRTATVDNSVKIFKEGNKYGYRTGSGVVLPAQFDDSDLFYDDYAMANRGGKWGILHLEDGDFTCAAPVAAKTAARRTKGKAKPAAPAKGFTVTTPTAYEKATIVLEIDDNGNTASESMVANGTAERKYPLAKPAGVYTAVLKTNDLVLYSQAVGAETKPESTIVDTRLRVSVSPSSARADINDKAIVTVTLTNPSDKALEVPLKITGKGMPGVQRTISIPAGGTRRVSAAFKDVFERESRSLTVNAGGVTVNKTVSLSPFFQKI